MARIDWVRERLENWARWCSQQGNNGLGYPSQSAFARLGGRARRAEAVIPVSAIDAEETDRAVHSLRWTRPRLFTILVLHYARGFQDHQQVARNVGCAVATVKSSLDAADRALAGWFSERQEQRERARQAAEAAMVARARAQRELAGEL